MSTFITPHAELTCQGNRWNIGIIVFLTVFTLMGCVQSPTKQEVMKDLFGLLADQGYEANKGLSGIYAPGNIIQTHEMGAEGSARPLASPIVFRWSKDCFPGQVPRRSPFAIPTGSGYSENAFRLGAGLLGRLLPSLSFDRRAVAEYQLQIGNTEVVTFAKADLSHQFAEDCVRALSQALEDGDKIEWYSVIVEGVVADSLNLEMNWQTGSSLEARTAQLGESRQQLGTIAKLGSGGLTPIEAGVSLAANNTKKSVIKVEGNVIIGYRARPLQPVYEK